MTEPDIVTDEAQPNGGAHSPALSQVLDRKRTRLIAVLSACDSVAVAFSAGVDSAVVAKAAYLACGSRASAVTAVSASLAEGELETAQQVAKLIGIRHLTIHTSEFETPGYVRNASNRCYFCKSELYARLQTMVASVDADVIVNGANLDDRGDHRPGMQAAHERGIRSPLIEAEFTKNDVRALARFWGLPIWNKPASPCLSSRIAYGLEVTPDRVRRVDDAERWLRKEFGIDELRVRHEAHDLARIEVPPVDIARLCETPNRIRITTQLIALGFCYVTIDLIGFRSGSMNAVVAVEELIRFDA